jgi:hypothetical protein
MGRPTNGTVLVAANIPTSARNASPREKPPDWKLIKERLQQAFDRSRKLGLNLGLQSLECTLEDVRYELGRVLTWALIDRGHFHGWVQELTRDEIGGLFAVRRALREELKRVEGVWSRNGIGREEEMALQKEKAMVSEVLKIVNLVLEGRYDAANELVARDVAQASHAQVMAELGLAPNGMPLPEVNNKTD